MERIWAPWRAEYVTGKKKKGCIFCLGLSEKTDMTLYQGDQCLVMLNRYPYTNGHLLVAPKRHVGHLEDLTGDERGHLMNMVTMSVGVLKTVMTPQGFNVGLNLGGVAGAGVADHLHMHIVPRWHGDANFITVVGEARVISEGLDKTFEKLKDAFDRIAPC